MASGTIVKALSGFYYVQTADKLYTCRGRGVFRNQNITPLVGDHVQFDITSDTEGYIIEIEQRRNELVRPPIANVSQAIVVNAAVQPNFSTALLDRFIVMLEAKYIQPIIVVTKKDLATEKQREEIEAYKQAYEGLGYHFAFVSLTETDSLEETKALLTDEITVLVGQSGVGKSTFLNTLDPTLTLETGEVSLSLGRGKHTTRHVEFLEIAGGYIADTPGFSSLDFTELEAAALSDCFVEMKERSHACKFRSCLHVNEPKCAIKAAVEIGEIEQYRYDHYLQFLQEINERKPRY